MHSLTFLQRLGEAQGLKNGPKTCSKMAETSCEVCEKAQSWAVVGSGVKCNSPNSWKGGTMEFDDSASK